MLNFHSDTDIRDLQNRLDQIQHESQLPDIEFARALLDKALEVSRAVARIRQNAGRPLHEPDFVSLAENIAGVVDHTNPSIQCRGNTMMHQLFEEAHEKISQIDGYKIAPLDFSMGPAGAFHHSRGDFTATLTPIAKGKISISINGQPAGEAPTMPKATRIAQAYHDAHLFRSSIGKLALLPFDCDDADDPKTLAIAKTPVGTYKMLREDDLISLYLGEVKVASSESVADAVTRATEHYASKVMST